jgi:uncharacterized protein (DUF2267 family)
MTTITRVDVFDRDVERAGSWIISLAAELGTRDRDDAYRLLKAFLHVLRDRLPVAAAVHLAARLPVPLRGVFYDGWQPSRTPLHYQDPQEFLNRVAREARLSGGTEVPYAVGAAARVLACHVGRRELAEVRRHLPVSLHALLDA